MSSNENSLLKLLYMGIQNAEKKNGLCLLEIEILHFLNLQSFLMVDWIRL